MSIKHTIPKDGSQRRDLHAPLISSPRAVHKHEACTSPRGDGICVPL